ncbi:MAG: class I SAM-dependent DNA methyltransferase [Candidatus Heimdallarchaeota archaeon]
MKDVETYSQLAKYYDKLYHLKDYKAECEVLRQLITIYKESKWNDLLDIACGTGSHLQYFNDYNRVGIDLNPEMVKLAKEKIPDAEILEMDMTVLDLNKEFDVVMCLFSSIGYILEKEKLIQTIKDFSNHLKKGGVLIIQPWIPKELYKTGSSYMTTYEDEDLQIARVNLSEMKGDNCYFEMHYLIGERNKKVQHYIETHELAFFSNDFIISLMKENGLTAEFYIDESLGERGFIIGVK